MCNSCAQIAIIFTKTHWHQEIVSEHVQRIKETCKSEQFDWNLYWNPSIFLVVMIMLNAKAFLTHWISNVLTWNLKIKWGKNTCNKIRLFKGMSLALNMRTKQNDTSFAIMQHLFTLSFQPSFISPLNLNCFKLTTNSSLGHKRFNQSKSRPRPALNALDWMEFISLMLIMSRIIQIIRWPFIKMERNSLCLLILTIRHRKRKTAWH